MIATWIINQYESSTGTKFVISGSNQLRCATISSNDAIIAVAAKVRADLLEKMIPERIVAQAIYIIDS